MKLKTASAIVLGILMLAQASFCQNDGTDYIPHGVEATADFERALFDRLPVYSWGVAPSPDVAKTALTKSELPETTLEKARVNIQKVLSSDLLPAATDQLGLQGLAKLHWENNCLIGNWTLPGNSGTCRVVSTPRNIGVTVISPSQFPDSPSELRDEKIIELAARVLDFPSETLTKFQVEKTVESLGGIPTVFGVLRCDYNERTSPTTSREWWSYIPFWMTQGQIFLHVSTFDWKSGDLPASSDSAWNF
jgi:hypothetical protein